MPKGLLATTGSVCVNVEELLPEEPGRYELGEYLRGRIALNGGILGEVRFLSSTVGKLSVSRQQFQSAKRPTTTKTLITGPMPGLGLHTARRLVALGHEVWVMISTYLPTRRRNPP